MKGPLFVAAVVTAAITFPASTATSATPAPEAIQQFGKCAARNYEGAELLATQPGTPEEAEVLAEYSRRACAAPGVDVAVLRGAVAEQLFISDFGSIGTKPRRELIEVFTIDLSELDALDEKAKKRIDYVAFGTCVAASDPEQSSALLKTGAGSAEEKAVMTALVSKFAPCVAEGARFNLSKVELRSALAEGAYRLALAQTLDEEVVVTGTRDRSKTVQCKRPAAGTYLRKTICMTESQWAARERANEYDSADAKRQSLEHNERLTTCITRSLFSDADGGGGGPCLMN